MQDIDPAFDEKNLGMSKFSRFVQEAAQRGLLSVTKLENGQLEVAPPADARAASQDVETVEAPRATTTDGVVAEREAAEAPTEREEREERGRRGRRGRGRGRGRDERRPEDRDRTVAPSSTDLPAPLAHAEEPVAASSGESVGAAGERLTRVEAFDLVRRAVETLTTDDDDSTRASAVRQRAREILGHDSESLNERMFIRILKDAHDAGVIDLRRRGDDFEVARAAEAASVADQVARADLVTAPPRSLPAAAPRLGMGPRGAGGVRGRSRLNGPPPELLTVGIVEEPAPSSTEATLAFEQPRTSTEPGEPTSAAPGLSPEVPAESAPPRRSSGRKRGRATPIISHPVQAAPVEGGEAASARKSRAKTAAKTAHRRARSKKAAPKTET
jgi:hypothetical protein